MSSEATKFADDAQLFNVVKCPGFGWDRVNFLLSSRHSVVFWI